MVPVTGLLTWPLRLIAAAWRRLAARRGRAARAPYSPAAGNGAIRALTATAVLLVAAIAAVVSFVHIEHLAVTHGQTRLAALLLPVSVDGTVAAASLSMLWAARAGLGTPWLARVMLALGVTATLAANVAYGAAFGLTGELLSGWPAVAFVGSVEMVLSTIRRTRPVPAVPEPPAELNGHARAAAELFAADIEAGAVPGIRAIRSGLQVGQDKASQVQAYLRELARVSASSGPVPASRAKTPGQLTEMRDPS